MLIWFKCVARLNTYTPAETGEYLSDIKTGHVAKKYLKDNKHCSLYLVQKYA